MSTIWLKAEKYVHSRTQTTLDRKEEFYNLQKVMIIECGFLAVPTTHIIIISQITTPDWKAVRYIPKDNQRRKQLCLEKENC